MKLNTGTYLENRRQFRASLHFFRWGVHFKLRLPSGTWRHLVIKAARGAAFGQNSGRRSVFIAWWQSKKGVRGTLNGWRFVVACDSLPRHPRDTLDLPFWPRSVLRDQQRKKEAA